MSKERQDYDVTCPRHYGFIKFIVRTNRVLCPVSGAEDCLSCDIVSSKEARESGEFVKKKEE